MPTTVQGPDGQEFEFPDGTPPDIMKSAMRKHYGPPASPVPQPASAQAPAPLPARRRSATQELQNAFVKAGMTQFNPRSGGPLNAGNTLKAALGLVGDLTNAGGAAIGTGFYNLTGGKSVNGQGNAPIEVQTQNGRKVYRFNSDGPWVPVPTDASGKPDLAAISQIKRPMISERATQDRMGNATAQALTFALPGGGSSGAQRVVGEGVGLAEGLAKTPLRPVVRMANKATGGKLLDPVYQAKQTLAAAIKRDGGTPEQVAKIVNEWQTTGASRPSLLDAISKLPTGGQATLAEVRGAAMNSPVARGVAKGYRNNLEANLQDNAQNLTDRLHPDERTTQEFIDQVGGQLQAKAKPLYEDLFANAGPQSHPALNTMLSEDALLGNPTLRKAIGPARNQVQSMGGRTFEEMTLPDVPEYLTSGSARSTGDYLADVKDLVGGGVKRSIKSDGPGLSQFVAKEGGIRDVGGDLRSMGAGDRTQSTGFGNAKSVIRNNDSGVHLDDMAERAWQAGYFKDVPSQRELMDAINRDMSGSPVLSVQNVGGGADRAEYLRQLEQRISTLQLPERATARQVADALAADDGELSALQQMADNGGIYPTNVFGSRTVKTPSLEVLDRAKRQLDEMEQLALKNGNTNDLVPIEATRKRLLSILDELNPNYAMTRAAGGEAPILGQAAKTGEGILTAKPARFAREAADLQSKSRASDIRLAPSAEANYGALQVGAKNALRDAIGSPSQGSTGVLNRISGSTNMQEKLRSAFPDSADLYRQGIGNEVTRVQNARAIDPNTGSQTAVRGADAGSEALNLVEGAANIKTGGAFSAVLKALREGLTLTDAERSALLELSTGQADMARLAPVRQTINLPARRGANLAPAAMTPALPQSLLLPPLLPRAAAAEPPRKRKRKR